MVGFPTMYLVLFLLIVSGIIICFAPLDADSDSGVVARLVVLLTLAASFVALASGALA